MDNSTGYYNFWGTHKTPLEEPKFTELEIALMEGGHSLEEPKKDTYSFIKFISEHKEPTLGTVGVTVE